MFTRVLNAANVSWKQSAASVSSSMRRFTVFHDASVDFKNLRPVSHAILYPRNCRGVAVAEPEVLGIDIDSRPFRSK